MAERINYASIDEYINACPEDTKNRLLQLREEILNIVPDASQKISWGMPTFTVKGHNLIHFALHKSHIGLYPGAECMEYFASEFTEYKTSKGALQLPLAKPMPWPLIRKIVNYCLILRTQ